MRNEKIQNILFFLYLRALNLKSIRILKEQFTNTQYDVNKNCAIF